MAQLSSLASTLQALQAQLTKVKTELTTRIAALEDQLADIEIPDDAAESLESIKALVDSMDAIVPDETP